MRLPDNHEPEPPGGRSAERLREFLAEHATPTETKVEPSVEDESTGDSQEGTKAPE